MANKNPRSLKMPKRPLDAQEPVIDCRSLVVVGANGSGKTRLGIWLEDLADQRKEPVRRIGAQRSLVFRSDIPPYSVLQAECLFLSGAFDRNEKWSDEQHLEQATRNKLGSRWGGNPATALLADYDHVLSVLMAREHQRNERVTNKARASGVQPHEVEASPKDQVMATWQKVMPQRQVKIENDRLYALRDTEQYPATTMSDGERVAFYLIAQAMCVPKDAIVIVDEPEIHLHKAIQSKLWDAIEAERYDCTFVYITHDLEFAASRSDATLIWVREYDGKNDWNWELVQHLDGFPTDLTLEILGSRKPVLFVEGTKDSLDTQIYRRVFPQFHIVPRGSCGKVIESTLALRAAQGFHPIEAFGLIDRDRRSDAELLALESDYVFAVPVAEAENLMCLPCIVEAAADHQRLAVADVFGAVKQKVFVEFRNDLQRQIVLRAQHEIHFQLSKFDRDVGHEKEVFVNAVADFKASIDPGVIHDAEQARLQLALDQSDYDAVLKLFNRKGLFKQVCHHTGKTPADFASWVIRELDESEKCDKPSEIGKRILNGLRSALPAIPFNDAGSRITAVPSAQTTNIAGTEHG